MADRSTVYFLFFIALWLAYACYEQDKEAARLFRVAEEQQKIMIEQQEALEAQQLYIKILEKQITHKYLESDNFHSPLHGQPL